VGRVSEGPNILIFLTKMFLGEDNHGRESGSSQGTRHEPSFVRGGESVRPFLENHPEHKKKREEKGGRGTRRGGRGG